MANLRLTTTTCICVKYVIAHSTAGSQTFHDQEMINLIGAWQALDYSTCEDRTLNSSQFWACGWVATLIYNCSQLSLRINHQYSASHYCSGPHKQRNSDCRHKNVKPNPAQQAMEWQSPSQSAAQQLSPRHHWFTRDCSWVTNDTPAPTKTHLSCQDAHLAMHVPHALITQQLPETNHCGAYAGAAPTRAAPTADAAAAGPGG